jgi:lipoprotein-anchoring transpeptidase ErfK/SrfK
MDERMRKILILLAIVGWPLVTAPHGAVSAVVQPSEQELLIAKKKKAEAARKAAAKQADDRKQARLAAERKQAERQLAGLEKARQRRAAPADCGSLLNCLFGARKRTGIQRASTGDTAVIDYETAEDVSWSPGQKYPPGSIVVQTPERALYLVLGDGMARRYKVGVGREGFQWSGNSRIVGKAEWPAWRPPQVMIEREAAKGHMLPDVMEGGPENPLGARALYIGGTMYRIHGTNNAASIGGAVSSGCIRMMNTDVVDLYDRVKVGARVYVYQ